MIYVYDTGNYKIVGRLMVNKVTVAEDYFVFNVNRTNITDRINVGDHVLDGE